MAPRVYNCVGHGLETECKPDWDLKERDLTEKIDIEKHGDRTYSSGIFRSEAIVHLWLGYAGSKATMPDLQLDSDVFRSYEVILFTNIARS